MRILTRLNLIACLYVVCVCVLVIGFIPTWSVRSATIGPTTAEDLVTAAPQGFGDRQNSITWSMAWWKGHLYVGTGRSTQCQQVATMAIYLPFVTYPPLEADIACASSPQDLSLQAEIWRWTPETATWQRVFQSPNDVPIPGHDGKFVARDIGFRGMTIFTEADGTEALYVSGVSSRSFNAGVAPPRILRSTDGETFTAVPQDAGTMLGDTDAVGFRGMTTYKNKLYVITSIGLLGQGFLMESADPASGNDSFKQVSPEAMTLYEVDTFNGYLYVGTASRTDPFAVLRTDATGPIPYQFTPVLQDGGNREKPSKTVVSLHEFDGRLYVGTDRPAELYRINPDDSWDLVVGEPRVTWTGQKTPLSGMSTGFDWFATQHIWRMETHGGRLYVSTMDSSTRLRVLPFGGLLLGPNIGFDLYSSDDGQTFTEISRNGLGDKFNVGVRNMVSTPYGLFIGSQNHYYGLQMWRSQDTYTSFLPAVYAEIPEATDEPTATPFDEPTVPAMVASISGLRHLAPARDLQAEYASGKTVLSWQQPAGATGYTIYRTDFARHPDFEGQTIDGELIDGQTWIPGKYKAIAKTGRTYYVDETTLPGRYYHYYVVAETAGGVVSRPSNLVRAPSLAAPVTFASLSELINQRLSSQPAQLALLDTLSSQLASGRVFVIQGDFDGARQQLEHVELQLNRLPVTEASWWVAEARAQLETLAQRLQLAQDGLIEPTALLQPGE